MNKQARDVFQVLIADDSADDRYLLRAAMRRAIRLQIVGEASDGAETIACLRKFSALRTSDQAPLPDLLLLDLRMPSSDGFEVLKWLQSQRFDRMTVVVLTDSMDPEHIRRALELGADFFQVKPRSHHERVGMVLALEQYLLTAQLVAPDRGVQEKSAPRPRPQRTAPTRQ